MHISRVVIVTDEIYAAFQRLIPQLTTNVPPPTRADLDELVAFAGSTLLAARISEDSPIVGVATLSLVRAPTGVHARLEDVVVENAARGQGIGAALTAEVIRLAREMGANFLALTSNPRREAANRLYQQQGFKRWQTNVYRLDL